VNKGRSGGVFFELKNKESKKGEKAQKTVGVKKGTRKVLREPRPKQKTRSRKKDREAFSGTTKKNRAKKQGTTGN